MPGRFEGLEVFLKEITPAKIGHIVCLVSDSEIAAMSPEYLAAIQRDEIPARLWRREIHVNETPDDLEALDRMLDLIRARMDEGESVVVHCAAGHVRTGFVAIRLLMRMGISRDEAAERIGNAGSAPDTKTQWDCLCH